jgi:hypothetical protein
MGDVNYDINYARGVARLINFYQVDHDHVLHRRFHRLHLYNIYQKHDRLVELDKMLGNLELAIKPNEKTGLPEPNAQLQAASLGRLLKDIDIALKDFGMFFHAYSWGEV